MAHSIHRMNYMSGCLPLISMGLSEQASKQVTEWLERWVVRGGCVPCPGLLPVEPADVDFDASLAVTCPPVMPLLCPPACLPLPAWLCPPSALPVCPPLCLLLVMDPPKVCASAAEDLTPWGP